MTVDLQELTKLFDQHVKEISRAYDQILPKAGFDSFAPADGAFYLYADVRKLTNDSTEFCHRMLHEAGVAATPGLDFDPERGQHTIRMSFAGSTADMEEAVARLKDWLS